MQEYEEKYFRKVFNRFLACSVYSCTWGFT